MFKYLLELFTKQFIKKAGRPPQTTAEMMSIQNQVVNFINKTKGVPEGPKKPPFQGFTPRVIEGGKSKEGITGISVNKKFTTKDKILKIDDELEKLSAGEGKYSKMNRNDREDLMIKLQDESSTLQDKTLFKDSPEAIAKIKAENKAAVERLKKKKTDNPEDMASGGIAGQLHLNRPGYQQGNEVVPPELRALKREDKNLFKKIMSYDKDVMPEEYQVPGSGGYGSILRHAGNTALLKKQLSEKITPFTGQGIADLLGGTLAFGGGTLHELTSESPIFTNEERRVDEALPFDVGPSKKFTSEFKEDMLANLYGALYGKTGIKDKKVLDQLIARLSRQDNWSKIFNELIKEQAFDDPERPMRVMPIFSRKKVRNPRTGKMEIKMAMIDSPFSKKKLTQADFIEEMEDKGKLATSATEGSFAKGGLAHILGV
jgi:hypothetical protein